MTTHSEIAKAFVKAQQEFAPALKTATNPHFRSKYVNLEGCIEAVIDALHNNGIALIQKTHDCDDGVKVETIFLHESGQELSGGLLHIPASKLDPHGVMASLTYCRRGSLMAACGIAPEDDDGNAAVKSMSQKVRETAPVKKQYKLNLPNKEPILLADEYQLSVKFIEIIGKLAKADIPKETKTEKARELYAANKESITGLAGGEQVKITNALSDFLRKNA